MRLEPNSLTFFLSSLPPPLTSPGSNSTGTPGLRIAGVVFSSVGVGIPILLFILISCVLCSACLKTAMMWLTVPRKNIQHSKNRIVILTINLSCSLQMSEPI